MTLTHVGLNREDAHTYQLPKEAHKEKTARINLILPSTVTTIPESFIHNGEATISLLQKLCDEGKLDESVATMENYANAIRSCIKEDIEDFHEKNIPSNAIEFPGKIKSSMIGERDCTNLSSIFVENDVSVFDEKACVKVLKKCVSKTLIRAAYINQGLNQYPVDSRAT